VKSSAGQFTAAMPEPWIGRTRQMPSPVGKVTDVQYLHEIDGQDLSYSITYADFSPLQLQQMSLEQIINSGRDQMVRKLAGRLETDRPITLDGHRGREIVVAVPGRGTFAIRYYIADSRLYTLALAGKGAAVDSREGRAFFGSFRITNSKR
jgi:hypothetical protein